MIAIWQRYLTDGGSKPLPLIIPMVVYHGAEPWNVPVDFSALFEPDEALAGIVPDFRYFLSDLGAQADHELSRFALLRSGLMALKHATRGVGHRQHRGDRHGGDLARSFLRRRDKVYLQGVSEDRSRRSRAIADHDQGKGGISIMVSNIAQEWIDEGKALGLLKGSRGNGAGRGAYATQLLTNRFGPLPAEVTARMEDADTDTLETWGEKLLDARTLDEFSQPKSPASPKTPINPHIQRSNAQLTEP